MAGSPTGSVRLLALATLLVVATVAGCTNNSEDQSGPAPPAPGPSTPPGVGEPRAVAPALSLGDSWSYAATGTWDTERSFTVVVATTGFNGHFFAAGAEDELAGEITWGRPWFGPRDLLLNRLPDQNGERAFRLFDFPLTDGKQWQFGERTVTASAEQVATPAGSEAGFVMRSEDGEYEWGYAPSVRFLTYFQRTIDGDVKLDARLEATGTSAAWVWYEVRTSLMVEAAGAPELGTVSVGADDDAVVLFGVGQDGGRGVVLPPGTGAQQPWTFEAEGEQRTFAEVRAPVAGDWTVALLGPPESEALAAVHAVQWVRPSA